MRLNFHGKVLGDRAFYGPEREEHSYLDRLAPFTVEKPCTCGSRNRVWNTRGQTFCGKCGRLKTYGQHPIR